MQTIITHSVKMATMLSLTATLFLLNQVPSMIFAQDKDSVEKTPSPKAIEISDAPKSIDPATLFPAALTKKVMMTFDGEQLKKVMNWLQQESNLKVNVDYKSLASVKLIETDPIFEKLDDVPLYMFLGRLEMLGIGWYVEGETLQIASRTEVSTHESTASYHLGDLFDAGYPPQDFVRSLGLLVGANTPNQGEVSAWHANLVGDVLFVRSSPKNHRELAGLLAALRNHGRRTLSYDPPQHDALRNSFNEVITVDFQETPLLNFVQELSRKAKVPIRLDRIGLAAASIRDRIPISLKLSEGKLGTALEAIHLTTGVTWYLRDNVIWISSEAAAQSFRKTAVYDVRDLCRDRDESEQLKDTIQKQSRAKWRSGESSFGQMETPLPGVLVVRHTEFVLDEVLELLESYRAALRVSKLRTFGPPTLDPDEVVTGYYRLPHPMAVELKEVLPRLILPETWKSEASPQSVGEILEISYDSRGTLVDTETASGKVKVQASDEVVLIIKQTRTAHQQIGKLISNLLSSKSVDSEATVDTTRKPKKTTVNFGSSLIPAESK